MSERDAYVAGTPNWVDIGSTDIARTTSFYSELLGWEVGESDPAFGGYGMFRLRGRDVAGFGPAQGEGVWWSCYIATDDVAATLALVTEHGGTVLAGPMEIPGSGTMAVCSDPAGAAFSLWQADGHVGCGVVNEPGTFCWSEVMTRAMDVATTFYPAVFGWNVESDGHYTTFTLNGAPVAGAFPMPAEMPDGVPNAWAVYFAVGDVAASAARVTELGGQIAMGPARAGEVGEFVVAVGPHHETFYLIQLDSPA